jgi:hypothetical protein
MARRRRWTCRIRPPSSRSCALAAQSAELGRNARSPADPIARLSVTDLTAGIAAKTFGPEQLRELLATEEASDDPRKNFIRAIMQALK